jgi:ArsR family transcriptional regulator
VDKVQHAQAQLLDGSSTLRLAELFKALSDPTRVRILSALAAGELCVCDIAAALDMTQSAISHQLRVLRQLRLVRRRKAGQMAFYTLDDEHVSDLFRQSLEHVLHR